MAGLWNGLQVNRTSAGTILDAENLVFNKIVTDLSSNISYDNTTGLFTINAMGDYTINWWVAVQTAMGTGQVTFALEGGAGTLDRANTSASSSGKTGEVSGVYLVRVSAIPFTFSLVNRTGGILTLSQSAAIRGSLLITEAPVGEAGVKGDTGEKGETGEKGATGESAPHVSFGGLVAQVTTQGSEILENKAVVPFDAIPAYFTSNIKNNLGIFTLENVGIYLVDWWIALGGSDSVPQLRIDLVDGVDNLLIETTTNTTLDSTISGNALVQVTEKPLDIKLINNSGGNIQFSSGIDIQANIRIVELKY